MKELELDYVNLLMRVEQPNMSWCGLELYELSHFSCRDIPEGKCVAKKVQICMRGIREIGICTCMANGGVRCRKLYLPSFSSRRTDLEK